MLSEQSNPQASRRSVLTIVIVLVVFLLLAILVWRWFDYRIARIKHTSFIETTEMETFIFQPTNQLTAL